MIRRITSLLTLALSLVALTPLHAAEGSLAGQPAAQTIVLTYTASPTAGVTYTMYRAAGACSATSSFTAIGTGITALTYTDASPLPGVQCYRATAVLVVNNVSSESAPSNQISLTSLVLPQQPQPPSGLAGTAN